MDAGKIAESIAALRARASDANWDLICGTFRNAKEDDSYEFLVSRLPSSLNSDLIFLLRLCIAVCKAQLSPVTFGLFLETLEHARNFDTSSQHTEIVWTGPGTPSFPVRRIDQVLYDLINDAKKHVFLISFAAAHVERLTNTLRKANDRGVMIRLLLESKEESDAQLSVSALTAFQGLEKAAQIYTWPLANRRMNQAGRPGKLHAKCALVDGCALISSANLTDDAFCRNMELGVLFRGGPMPQRLREHFDALIDQQVIVERTL